MCTTTRTISTKKFMQPAVYVGGRIFLRRRKNPGIVQYIWSKGQADREIK
jgi:hypothetical protein